MSGPAAFGINAVDSLVRRDPARVARLLLARGGRNRRLAALAAAARAAGIVVAEVPRAELDRLAAGERHQDVVAELAPAAVAAAPDLDAVLAAAGDDALLLVLDGVTDPHNLGACLRSAAAAGAQAVIVPRDRAAGMTPVVRKVASGGAERVPLVQVANLARALREIRAAGIWVTGLAGDGAADLYTLDLRGPSALVLGGEGGGLRRLTREHCDYLAAIPMPGGMESLNVSVAAGVALFEAVRQRALPVPEGR